jgi:alpha-ribazole phosphatase
MELYLVRHTTPQVAAGVCYGHTELELHPDFDTELAAVQAKLAGLAPGGFYTSPLLRCRKLAEALPFGQPQHDDRLKELHFGKWEMQAWDAIPREALSHWGDNFVEMPPPGGESFNDLYRRAHDFFADSAARHRGRQVVAVTHAGVIRALLALALNLDLRHVPNFLLDFGGVTKLVVAEPYVKVAYVNR